MNFEFIEGLSDQEVMDLFDENDKSISYCLCYGPGNYRSDCAYVRYFTPDSNACSRVCAGGSWDFYTWCYCGFYGRDIPEWDGGFYACPGI